MSGERQVPFFCPYCGEENLRPESVVGLHWRPEDIVFVEDSESAGAPLIQARNPVRG